jgi:hypothetical protein
MWIIWVTLTVRVDVHRHVELSRADVIGDGIGSHPHPAVRSNPPAHPHASHLRAINLRMAELLANVKPHSLAHLIGVHRWQNQIDVEFNEFTARLCPDRVRYKCGNHQHGRLQREPQKPIFRRRHRQCPLCTGRY